MLNLLTKTKIITLVSKEGAQALMTIVNQAIKRTIVLKIMLHKAAFLFAFFQKKPPKIAGTKFIVKKEENIDNLTMLGSKYAIIKATAPKIIENILAFLSKCSLEVSLILA